MRGPFKRKRRAPKELIVWGECGVRHVAYKGEMPQDFVGHFTQARYAFNERRPALGVDVRDLPGLAQDGGRENFEGLPEPERPKAKPKQEEQPEVTDAARMDNDG